MNIHMRFLFLAFLAVMLFVATGCEEAAEEALEEATGMDFDLDGDEVNVDTPDKWRFLFAVNLDETQAEQIDGDFSLDISLLQDLIDLDDIEYQVVFARVADVEGDKRLRFANKVKVDDNKIKLDSETNEKLGDSVGSSGAGWYACYFATEEFGFVNGEVVNCEGNKVAGVLAVASDGPFFTLTADDGSWALPSLGGKPATTYFSEGDDCSGNSSDPVDDEPNPKDPEETPDMDPFSDDTDNTDAGEDEMDDTGGDAPATGERFDFEDGDEDFVGTGNCWGVSSEAYDTLFPDGDEANYLYLTSGGNQNPSCTVSRTFTVPDGATELVVSYDFMSQEWEEWAFSAYNDMFTAIIQGAYDYVINRTVDNVALDDDWADVSLVCAGVDSSADATYNATTGVFDGHLKWGSSGDNTPRGGSEDQSVGQVASFPVEAGATITLLMTVSDVGDKIYDSAATIDWIEFR